MKETHGKQQRMPPHVRGTQDQVGGPARPPGPESVLLLPRAKQQVARELEFLPSFPDKCAATAGSAAPT
eukprot:9018720-Pyramimonas_sp.AAC.1